MRNVFRLLFIGALLFALSGLASGAEDIPGFKGYTWGTDFSVIHQAKDLKLIKTVDGVSNCLGKKDSEFDTQGRPAAGYVYRFYNNKLVAGDIVFFNQSRYVEAVKVLEIKFGKPVVMMDGKSLSYNFANTTIYCVSEDRKIYFASREYLDDDYKRNKEADKVKNDHNFNKIFN